MIKLQKVIVLIIGAFLLCISIPIKVHNNCQIFPFPTQFFLGMPWKKIPCKYTGIMWGPSALEYVIGFKNSIDINGFWFLYK